MPEISRSEAKSLGLKRYYTGLACKRGHFAERRVGNRGCVECYNLRSCARHRENVVINMLRSARARARAKGIPFSLTRADVVIPPVCPVFGVEFVVGGTGASGFAPNPRSPSLDRINGPAGYVPGNVIVVSYLANSIKYTATPDQILAVGKFYKRLFDAPALAAQ